MRYFGILFTLVVLASCSVRQNAWTDRNVPGRPLVKWSFLREGDPSKTWQDVRIPHSYNAWDGHSQEYYRGRARYRTRIPGAAADTPRYLLFEGAAQGAVVLFNGDTLTTHSGGYTPFWVDITGKGAGEIEVVCDNFQDEARIPLTSDFNKNGGLHNPVWLLELPQIHFSPDAYGLYRLHVGAEASDSLVLGKAQTRLCNASALTEQVEVQWRMKDASGATVLSHRETVELEAGAEQDLAWDFSLANPHLWNGLADPYLYTVSVQAGKDKARTEVGFRYFRLDREEGFFLNGKSYPLHGTGMHQDKQGCASALWKADYDEDYKIVKELGCNFLRLAHYPHNDYAFRLCDRMGIVVQTEIPWVNNCGINAPDAYFDNIFQQMEEMVNSLYNHPSICLWGMWNELDTWGHTSFHVQGDQLDAARVVAETARLYDFTKKLDPYRPVGLTDDSVFRRDGYTGLKADFFSENRYNGWYYTRKNFEAMTPDMVWIKENVGITNLSEYGVGVNPYCHTWKEEDIRRDKSDSLHVEEYGNRFHESYAAQIARAPWMNFSSIWILFDFAVAARQEGFLDSDDGVHFSVEEARKYTNDKGLVTRDRKVKKDAFYLYKAWWNHSVETVYITSRRLQYRPAGEPFILTVYSNAPSLEVFCNGQPVAGAFGTEEPTGVVWKFPVRMGDSPTTFRVQSPDGTVDEVTWLPLPL